MANYQNLKSEISAAIRTNGNQEITGQVLQDVLNSIVSVIGANYTFAGVATPATNPGTPDQNVMYLAMEGGTYTNFNGTVLPAGISLLMWNGTWRSETVMYGDGGVFDISVYKSSGGTLATFADLAAALDGGNNIPASARKGGMSVKFIQGTAQSSDNKYVQVRLMANSFTTDTTQWQGVDNIPTAGSNNIVKSGGVYVEKADKNIGRNLFNPDKAIPNSFLNSSGVVGTIAGHQVTDYIKVTPGKTYRVLYKSLYTENTYIVLYDENFNAISSVNAYQGYITISSELSGTLYARFTISNIENYNMIAESDYELTNEDYIPYSDTMSYLNDSVNVLEETVTKYDYYELEKIDGILRYDNLSSYGVGNHAIVPVLKGEYVYITCKSYNNTFCGAFIKFKDNITKQILVGSNTEYTNCKYYVPADGDLYIQTGDSSFAIKLKRLTFKYNNELGSAIKATDIIVSNINVLPYTSHVKGFVRLSDGKLINEGTDTTFFTWKYIPVKQGDVIPISVSQLYDSVAGVAAYNADKIYVSSASHANYSGDYTVPSGVAYISITDYQSNINNTQFIYMLQGKQAIDILFSDDKNLQDKDRITIVCDGDSLTFGVTGDAQAEDNYPTTLAKLLGDSFRVINAGVPGSQTPTIVGNATGYRALESFTIPSSSVETVRFRCAMFGDASQLDNPVLTPISSFGTLGDINPAYIRGIKGYLGHVLSGGVHYGTFRRDLAGEEVDVNVGDVIFTKESIAYPKATHFVFMGANGGFRITGDSSDNSVQNINSLISQYKNIIRKSDNKYLAFSYYNFHGENGNPVWNGEAAFEEEFGEHYVNLREFFSTDAINYGNRLGLIQKAIEDGELDDTTYPTAADTAAMEAGNCPPSCLHQDGVHLKNWAYAVLGYYAYERYCDLVKLEITGAL